MRVPFSSAMDFLRPPNWVNELSSSPLRRQGLTHGLEGPFYEPWIDLAHAADPADLPRERPESTSYHYPLVLRERPSELGVVNSRRIVRRDNGLRPELLVGDRL